jgi:UDP-N-acetylmuramate dehydrogenase
LIRDNDIAGLVIFLSAPAFGNITVQGNCVKAGGGAKLAHLVATSVREGLAGLEQLVGIPGTVGGALHGNAGGHGGDIGQWVVGATVMTRAGEILERSTDDMHFAYRQSSLNELAILDARLELERDDPQRLMQQMQKLWIVRKAQQPLTGENCGCIFKDSGGMSPSDLIDQAGLKGTRVGQAEVSQRDPNFFVVAPGAKAADVISLIDLVRSEVTQRLGVELETQIEIW